MGNANSSGMGKGLSDRDLLALSVQEGHSDSIPLFLKKNPSMLQLQFHNRNSLLHIAVQKGHVKALEAIFKTAKEGLLNGSASSGDIISKLLNQQNKDGRTALVIACMRGFADCARCLVSYGADVWVADYNGRTALHHSALRGHSECVRVLLEKYQTALQLSVNGPDDDAAAMDGSPTASSSPTSSHKPDHPGHKALQQTPASRYANVRDSSGITPLHCAAWSGDVETAVTLLRGGAFLAMQSTGDCYDKEITCNAGSTPLHIAALKGEIEMVTMMLCDYVSNCRDGHMHIDPRAITDAYNVTPYQLATSREHQDVAALLNPMTLIGDMVRNRKLSTDDAEVPAEMSISKTKDQSTKNAVANGHARLKPVSLPVVHEVPAKKRNGKFKDQSSKNVTANGPVETKWSIQALSSLVSVSSEAADFISLLNSSSSSAAPDWFVCPITQQVLVDPVVASDGFTYEREAITTRLQADNLTSPVTDEPLTSRLVFPNTVLYLAIKEWQLHMQRLTSKSKTNAETKEESP